MSAPTSRSELTKCVETMSPRVIEVSLPVRLNSTVTAPSSDSDRRKPKAASEKTQSPGFALRPRKARTSSQAPRPKITSASSRCENSISVSTLGDRGTIAPLQVGQCEPQPAPEPVARTTAPWMMSAQVASAAVHASTGVDTLGIVPPTRFKRPPRPATLLQPRRLRL